MTAEVHWEISCAHCAHGLLTSMLYSAGCWLGSNTVRRTCQSYIKLQTHSVVISLNGIFGLCCNMKVKMYLDSCKHRWNNQFSVFWHDLWRGNPRSWEKDLPGLLFIKYSLVSKKKKDCHLKINLCVIWSRGWHLPPTDNRLEFNTTASSVPRVSWLKIKPLHSRSLPG